MANQVSHARYLLSGLHEVRLYSLEPNDEIDSDVSIEEASRTKRNRGLASRPRIHRGRCEY